MSRQIESEPPGEYEIPSRPRAQKVATSPISMPPEVWEAWSTVCDWLSDESRNCPSLLSDHLSSSKVAETLGQAKLGHLEHEVFAVAWLSSQQRLLAWDEMFTGTIDGCAVHKREIVKAALRANAAGAVLYHNHPSGFTKPSGADIAFTADIKAALALIEVNVLDHVVVSRSSATSLAEEGLMP